jgi:hypothetical protein
MTPQEKAKDLVSEYNFKHLGDRYILHQSVEESKRCALIAVDEMILVLPFTDTNVSLNEYAIHLQKYLQQVKQEIEKL